MDVGHYKGQAWDGREEGWRGLTACPVGNNDTHTHSLKDLEYTLVSKFPLTSLMSEASAVGSSVPSGPKPAPDEVYVRL